MSDRKFFACLITAFLVIISGVPIGIRQAEHNLKVSSCSAFGPASGFQTKFVEYNFWEFGCLARTKSGKWVETKNLHEVNQ